MSSLPAAFPAGSDAPLQGRTALVLGALVISRRLGRPPEGADAGDVP